MSDWVMELNERSKNDRDIIVGSEVRSLCGEIARLRAEVDRERVTSRDALSEMASTVALLERVAGERDALRAENGRLRTASIGLLALIGHSPVEVTPDVTGTYNQRVEALFAALATTKPGEGA